MCKQRILVIHGATAKLARRMRRDSVGTTLGGVRGAATATAASGAVAIERVQYLLADIRFAMGHAHVTENRLVGSTQVRAQTIERRKAAHGIDHPRAGGPHGRARLAAELARPRNAVRRGRLRTRDDLMRSRVGQLVTKPTRRTSVRAASGELLPSGAVHKPHVHRCVESRRRSQACRWG